MLLPDRGPLAIDLELAGVEVLIRPLAVIRRELATPAGGARLALRACGDAIGLGALARRRRVALVHSNTSVTLSGAAAAAAARIPHVWHVREIYARFGRAWPPYRRLLTTARTVVCVSRAAALQFRGSDRAQVIHDGLAIDPARAPRAAAREALGLPAGAPAVAVIGRISDWKGQDVLVRALAERALAERGVLGLIAGEPWPGAEERLRPILDLARRLGVSDRLRLLGFRDDVSLLYGAADVVAVPSTEPDPLPGAAIEAAAAGCPVVASAHGGLPEIIEDGVSGRLVAPRDPGALAAAVADLLDDPGVASLLGAAARARARERFAPGRLLSAIHDLYDSVLGRD